MTAKIIKLNRTGFHDFIDELVKAYDEDRLRDFITIYDCEYREDEKIEGFSGSIPSYWFSDSKKGSTISCLGMMEIMKQRILLYIEEKNEEL